LDLLAGPPVFEDSEAIGLPEGAEAFEEFVWWLFGKV
jgi:hypothetical protein